MKKEKVASFSKHYLAQVEKEMNLLELLINAGRLTLPLLHRQRRKTFQFLEDCAVRVVRLGKLGEMPVILWKALCMEKSCVEKGCSEEN